MNRGEVGQAALAAGAAVAAFFLAAVRPAYFS